jgi:hypothetical protein
MKQCLPLTWRLPKMAKRRIVNNTVNEIVNKMSDKELRSQ